jgi:ABC-type nitrate/sulfonate/bicarbonate transport system permease component
MVKAARSLGAKDRQILREVVIPTALPMIFAALRLGIVVSLVLLIIAEMVAANHGLGYFILDSQRLWDTPKVFAGIAVITFLGFTFDRIMLSMEGIFLAWHKGKSISGL